MNRLLKKYGEEYLKEKYGLTWNEKLRSWFYKENEINTTDLRNGKVYTEERELEEVNLDKLVVNDGDMLSVTMIDSKGYDSKLLIENENNSTFGTLWGGYFSDDGRFYTMGNIAKLFINYNNVTIINYLLWDNKYAENYVKRIEN